jgi:hypothetical protein
VLPQYKDGKVHIPLVWKQDKLLLPDFIPECCRNLEYAFFLLLRLLCSLSCWTGSCCGYDAHLAACVPVRVRVTAPTSTGISSGRSTS